MSSQSSIAPNTPDLDEKDPINDLLMQENAEVKVSSPDDATSMLEIFEEAKESKLSKATPANQFFNLKLFKPVYEKFLRKLINSEVPIEWRSVMLAHACVTPDYLAHSIKTNWGNQTGNFFLRHEGLQKEIGCNTFNILGAMGCASSANNNGPYDFEYPYTPEGNGWKPKLGQAFNTALYKQHARSKTDYNAEGDTIVRKGKGAERAVFFSLPQIETGEHQGAKFNRLENHTNHHTIHIIIFYGVIKYCCKYMLFNCTGRIIRINVQYVVGDL